jgi:serine/threonine protein kinase
VSFSVNCCQEILSCFGCFPYERVPLKEKEMGLKSRGTGQKVEEKFFALFPVGGVEEESFENKGLLDGGHARSVYKVIAPNNEPYALKLPLDAKYEYENSNEAKILLQLNKNDPERRESIVRIAGVYQSRHGTALLLNLEKMNLFSYLEQKKRFSLREVRFVLNELAGVLSFLKEQGVIHGDIKLLNVFISEDGRVCLGDFGGSVLKEKGKNKWVTCATREYMSPEVILGLEQDYPVDVWSLACLVFSLMTGGKLFPGKEYGSIIRDQERRMGFLYPQDLRNKASLQGKARLREADRGSSSIDCLSKGIERGTGGEVTPKVAEDFEETLRGMLHPRAEKRWTPEEIRESNFIRLKKA